MESKEILTVEGVLSEITGIPAYRIKANDNGEYITKLGALKAMEEYKKLRFEEAIKEIEVNPGYLLMKEEVIEVLKSKL